MPDDGAVAVAEAPVAEVSSVESAEVESTQSTETQTQETDRQDGRKQPDALRKRIAEIRRQADSITDPAEKQRLLDDAKELNNRVGKVAAYEQHFATVREARETKALIDSLGGREGLTNLQSVHAKAAEIDKALETGDPSIVGKMWEEAPQGMAKLAPVIFARLEQANPQEYAKAVIPHAVKFFDNAGFPEAFDQMVQLYQGGKKAEADALALRLGRWFSSQRPTGTEARPDP
jgi:hypothetical protein